MSHVRADIREAYLTYLAGLPTTGPRVLRGRDFEAQPLTDAEIGGGCLVLDWSGEQVQSRSMGGPTRRDHRSFTLRVRAVVKTSAEHLALLDSIAVEVESRMAAGPQGGAKAVLYAGASGPEVSQMLERKVAGLAMLFEITYHVAAAAPDQPL